MICKEIAPQCPSWSAPTSTAAARTWAARCARTEAGIVYGNVRRSPGHGVAVIRPKSLSKARPAGHIGPHRGGLAL